MTIPSPIDHVETGQSRLLSQWQDKPNMSGLVKSIMQSIQEIEDTLTQIKDNMNIFDAVGEQLDIIGKLVGLERAGMDDATYRAEILKQISINRSDGTPEIIISLMEAATQTDDSNFWEHYPASVFYFVRGGYFNKLKEILEAISQAGVRSLLMFDEGDCFIPSEHLLKLEFLIDDFLDKFEITDGTPTGPELWSDPATLTGTGWADNGDGSYTHSGVTSGEVRDASGSLIENKLYAITVTASGGGTFSLQAGGAPTNGYNSITGLEAGTHTIVLAAENVASINALRIISSSAITVGSISVREALLDYLVVSFLVTQFLPTSMSYLPEIQEVINGTDLWTDPASTIESGWINNGGGSYSHSGASSELRSGAGLLEEEQLYSVELTVSGAGSVQLVAGGVGGDKNTVSGLTAGDHLFNIRAQNVSTVNAFRFISNTTVTISGINIKAAQTINPLCDIVEFTG